MPTPKNKRKFALWLYPETLDKVKQLYTEDDCRSKSEFIEKAVQFYRCAMVAIGEISLLRRQKYHAERIEAYHLKI